jgi:AAA15 family ATPase/GTPase
MLVQFSIKNFKIFKNQATLSMLASEYLDENETEANLVSSNPFGLRLLRSAVIYGANASGKSKFLEALIRMRNFAISSSKDGQKGDAIPVEPFLLSAEDTSIPTEFEVIFLYQNTLFRYGFEVDQKQVYSEWLYQREGKNEVEIFFREKQACTTHPKKFSRGAMIVKEDMLRDNALLLSVAAQFNDSICGDVLDWFHSIVAITDITDNQFRSNALQKMKNAEAKKRLVSFLKKADFGIRDIEILESNAEITPSLSIIHTLRQVYDQDGRIVYKLFSMQEDESEGTKKYFFILGPVIDVLNSGGILLVDELDAKLHPNLVRKLIGVFHSSKINNTNAQLIFNSHNTNLLQMDAYRRDQIWFAEKNRKGEGRLYALSDFQSSLMNTDLDREKCYIMGRYGAIPCLDDFDN